MNELPGKTEMENQKKYHCKWYSAFFSKALKRISKKWYQCFELPYLKSQLGGCGEHVSIGNGALFSGKPNIFISDNVYIGPNSLIYSAHARVFLGSHV
ncbi:MAG: hypothetical protein K6C36_10065, partial [Clostridia bacterium]|nr:hypothetical protein [Clostridia bacterium]